MEKRVNNLTPLALAFARGAFCMCAGVAEDAPNAMTHTARDAPPQAIVTATTAFLDSLSADQRVQVQSTFTPQQTASVAHFTGKVVEAAVTTIAPSSAVAG